MAAGVRFSVKKVGNWAAAYQAGQIDLSGPIRTALAHEAEFLADKVRTSLKKGTFRPLSDLTLKGRKVSRPPFSGTKILQVTGDLFNAIKATPEGKDYFVGILRTARQTGSKESLANLADVHERGRTIVIRVTPKMLKFLFGVLLKDEPPGGEKSGTGLKVLVIHIPARPFIEPAFAQWAPTSADRFMGHLTVLVKGLLGSL